MPHRTSIAAILLAAAPALVQGAPLGAPTLAAGQDIRVENGEITVNAAAVTVVRYTWRDSVGDPRSVSLVPASASTSGYAVQFSYMVNDGGKRHVYVNADPGGDGGFGYFVSHELYRDFNGDQSGDGTLAALHAEDDSPLGRYLPSTGSAQSAGTTQATHEFRHTYPRWGTVAAMPNPDAQTSSSAAAHQKFNLPVTIRWHFVAGRDHPLWTVEYDLSAASDRISNDVRGPYGVMQFNEGNGPAVTALKWGDKFKFSADAGASDFATAASPSNGTSWTWNVANTGRRYNVLAAGSYEFGLVDIVSFAASRHGDSYANQRGTTKPAGGGCNYGMLAMPCDWEWAYQSFQYEGVPSRPKLAWGSSFYLGSSQTLVFVNPTETETIVPKGRIRYGLHIVLGRSGAGAPLTLARAAAAIEADPTLTLTAVSGGTMSFTVLGDGGGPYTTTRGLKPWDSVALVAAPSAGATFSAWTGACAGVSGTTCIITMDQSRTVGATFSAPPPPLDPLADADGDGIPNGVETTEGRNPNVKDNDIFTVARLFAMQQYRDFLGREGDAGGITHWTNQLSSGAQTRAQMAETFFTSAEFQGTGAPVARLYFAYFLRIPDYGGLQFWISQFRGGSSLLAISNAFAGSPEFGARYGALTNSQFVSLVYQNVLGRAPDGPGLAHWTGQLDGGMTRGQMMIAFSESAEYRALIGNEIYVTMMYVGMLRREPDAGGFSHWVGYMDAGNSGLALTGAFVAASEYRGRFLP